ncbi:MAG: hypothetical protein HYU73_07115 [Betaproteobacteria bacterium]|nr:hypothetical protein [Betaproteobacteria bacterium]MBI3053417.1 hypothetical protein [Betaproteobacteria bacterium]
MTLIVTEVSDAFGCVAVGDSAVTIGNRVVYGAQKLHYSSLANLGFAVWGNACLRGHRVDDLLSSYVASLGSSATPRAAGRELAALLAHEGALDGRDWERLRGGVHICGYENDLPVLFHIHTGDDPPATQGPFQLHEDYPDGSAGCQLRNGYYKIFAGLFDGMEHYAQRLGGLGYKWPYERIEDRVSYYSIMVDTVARTLEAARRVPSVGGSVSAFAFNRDGIQVDKRASRGTEDFCSSKDTATAASFGEATSNFSWCGLT